MSPDITCRVLNRIANRHRIADTHSLTRMMDYATQLLWNKQEQYYKQRTVHQQDNFK